VSIGSPGVERVLCAHEDVGWNLSQAGVGWPLGRVPSDIVYTVKPSEPCKFNIGTFFVPPWSSVKGNRGDTTISDIEIHK
jgi:hypothetical protein